MGLALGAELNGYSGPSHVLELADQLSLTVAQGEQIQQQFNSMRAEAQPLEPSLSIVKLRLIVNSRATLLPRKTSRPRLLKSASRHR